MRPGGIVVDPPGFDDPFGGGQWAANADEQLAPYAAFVTGLDPFAEVPEPRLAIPVFLVLIAFTLTSHGRTAMRLSQKCSVDKRRRSYLIRIFSSAAPPAGNATPPAVWPFTSST